MSKAMKIWLIVGASLILIGCIILGGAMSMMKWDFTKLSTNQYETNEHTVTEAFQGISVHTNTADIIFARTEEDACSVVCFATIIIP